MKKRFAFLLLTLCLFLPLAAFSEGSEVSCQAGDTIEVIFSPVSETDMPAMLVGQLEYDHDVFEPVPGQFSLTSQGGLYIYADSPAKVSFRVSRFTPDGTYEISLKVLDAAGSGAEQVTVPPVQVTVGGGRAASSETVAVLSVSGHCGDNAFWDYQDGTLTIYGSGATYDYADAAQVPWNVYRDTMTHIVINNGITSIGQYHFHACTALTSVSLPNSLKVIGPAAFEACTSLAKITLPGHLEDIQEYAFYNCSSLTNAKIPENVWQIGDSAFRNCSSLLEINLPESVTSIGPAAFRGCVRAAALTLSPQMTMIPYDCFDGCSSLTAVTIPSSVTTIGYRAFEDCQALTSVIIPESLTAIDVSMVEHEEKNSAFSGCSKLSIWCLEGSEAQTYAKNNNIPIVIQDGKCGENLYWKLDGAELVICGSGGMDDFETDKTPWASYKASIQSLHVCEGVTKIGRNAFYECALSHIDFPQSLKVIRYRSFLNNRSLTDVVFPEGLEEIHQDAFSNCKNLKSIIFPSTLKSISGMAFQNIAIETVALPDSIQNISGNPFCCCVNLSAFALGNSAYFQLIDNVLYSKDGKEMISYPLASDAKKYTVKPGTEIIVPYHSMEHRILKKSSFRKGLLV